MIWPMCRIVTPRTDYLQTDQTGHDLDRLVPRLPMRKVVQDLYRTANPGKHGLDHAQFTGPTRQDELDHAGRECICLE